MSEDDELYSRLITLEKEGKLKNDQIEEMIHEKKALEKIALQQEEALVKLTRELQQANEFTMKLQVQHTTHTQTLSILPQHD